METFTQETPLVSIVLPVYNGEKYLAEAITSILKQTYKNWELIIVNDCSTDNSLDIAEHFQLQDKRIRIISNRRNLQIARSLNKGMKSAKGQYLAWTSDDNMYKPNALKVMLEYLTHNPQVDFVYSALDIIDENNQLIRTVFPDTIEKIYLRCVVGFCFLYKRIIPEKIGGYNSSWSLVQDYEYWIRCSRYFNMVPIYENLYIYRRHPLALTHQKKPQLTKEHENLIIKYLKTSNISKKNKAKCYYILFKQQHSMPSISFRLDLILQIYKFSKLYFISLIPNILFGKVVAKCLLNYVKCLFNKKKSIRPFS